jgi:hypothetical protein
MMTNTNAFAVDWSQGGSVPDYGANALYRQDVYTGGRKDSINNVAQVLAGMQHQGQPQPRNDFWEPNHVRNLPLKMISLLIGD